MNRYFNYSYKFCLNNDGIDLSNILDENGTVDISDMNFNDVLLEDFSDKANKFLGLLSTLDLLDK